MDGYYRYSGSSPLPAEYEHGVRGTAEEWEIPLRWVTVWVGTLSAISLGLGLLLKALLQ